MTKRQSSSVFRFLKRLSFVYLLALAFIFGAVALYSLRQNNLEAVHLRDVLLKTDEQNGDVETALNNLRSYVYSHMNTNLASSTSVYPPIQLKYRYERLVLEDQKRVDAVNTTIYNDAQKHCEQQNPNDFFGTNRVPCVSQYAASHGIQQVKAPPDSLYKFDFSSPRWSPDLAGWSLVACAVFSLLALTRQVAYYSVKSSANSYQ